MPITIDLAPEAQAIFQMEATARGLRVEEHLQQLMEGLVTDENRMTSAHRPRASLDEFERDMERFSEGTESLPPLSDEDLTREAMYADHD